MRCVSTTMSRPTWPLRVWTSGRGHVSSGGRRLVTGDRHLQVQTHMYRHTCTDTHVQSTEFTDTHRITHNIQTHTAPRTHVHTHTRTHAHMHTSTHTHTLIPDHLEHTRHKNVHACMHIIHSALTQDKLQNVGLVVYAYVIYAVIICICNVTFEKVIAT